MQQPKADEITNKLNEVIDYKTMREEVGQWTLEFIMNDDNIEINDIKAWHYLVTVSSVDEMIAPDEYLYSDEDIKEWIEENTGNKAVSQLC